MSDNSCIAIIPARGGSKGIMGKNICLVAGKPLINWTIEQAQRSACFGKIIVTTDDNTIATIAHNAGSEVPFLRPEELAQDDTPDYPVYEHTIKWLSENQNYQPELVVWLRPTSPLRTSEDIISAIRLIKDTNADCVRSVCLVEHHPYWMKKIKDKQLLPFLDNLDEQKYYRRQLLPPVYRLNGAVDVVRNESVRNSGKLFHGNIVGYIMPNERSIDIDNEIDLMIAEELLIRRLK